MKEQPNILFIMTDQQRFDSLAAYGFAGGHTPHLDTLARDGVVFENCYTTNPICTPARASLMTGHHLPGHGVYQLYDVLPDEHTLFPKHLQSLGYQTALVGKLHVSSLHEEAERRHPNDGFDVYEWCNEGCVRMDSPFHAYADWLGDVAPEFRARLEQEGRAVLHHPAPLHLSTWAAERTINFVEERDPEKPFFCMMSLFDPHNPYQDYPNGVQQRLEPELIPPPIPGGSRVESHQRERAHGYFGTADAFSATVVKEMRCDYHANIAFLDEQVGRVLERLDELGLRENTLVVFTSDHGDMLGDHDLFVKGAFFYEPNVRVPLLMRWPGVIPKDSRSAGLVQLNDLAATALAAAGMEDEKLIQLMPDARNLLPQAKGESRQVRDAAVCAYRNSGISQSGYWDPPIHATMLREGVYKLTVYHREGAQDEFELFDLGTDPEELTNLWDASSPNGVALKLLSSLLTWEAAWERRLSGSAREHLPSRANLLDNKA